MSGVHDDLATLRRATRFSQSQPSLSLAWDCRDALARVEAEINEMRQVIRDHHAALATIGGGPCVCKFCRE